MCWVVLQETELARLQYERDVLRQERDFYKMQYQSLKSQREVSSRGSPTSGSLPGATPTPAGLTTTTTAAAASSVGGPTTTTTTGGGGGGGGGGMPIPVGAPGVGPAGGTPRGVGTVGAPPPRPLSVPIGGEWWWGLTTHYALSINTLPLAFSFKQLVFSPKVGWRMTKNKMLSIILSDLQTYLFVYQTIPLMEVVKTRHAYTHPCTGKVVVVFLQFHPQGSYSFMLIYSIHTLYSEGCAVSWCA